MTIGIIGSLIPAYAATVTISDQVSCESIGGVWVAATSTCTLSTSLVIPAGDTLIINSGITLEFALDKSLQNMGSITNNGIITITGDGKNVGNLNNTATGTFTNTGTINLNGGSDKRNGNLINRDSSTFTNSGTINIIAGTGEKSGALRIIQSSSFTNTNSIIIMGGDGKHSGYLGLEHSGIFENTGTVAVSGGSGFASGLLDNWDSGRIKNKGLMTITGGSGENTGRITNMGTGILTNNGQITIIEGSGFNSGRLINSDNANFKNIGKTTISAGSATSNFPLLVLDSSKITNRGIIELAKSLGNTASISNFGSLMIGKDLSNDGKTTNNCGTIIISGVVIGNKINEIGCGSSSVREDPTIGKTRYGIQIVENGICIDIKCWTVTADYHQDFELVELLSNSIHTISTTVYCHNGVSKCNYVAIGVSPYGTNINESVWKIILQKDHLDNWTMKVIDPEEYLGDVSSTTQIVNDDKQLGVSITALFKKPTPGMILNVEVRDSYGGYRDFQFNDGIEIKDTFAYPIIETSYEAPIEIEPLCHNENPNKRYTCAFEKLREWTIKNAETELKQIKN